MATGPSAAVAAPLTVSGDSRTMEVTALVPDPAFLSVGPEIGVGFVLGNVASVGHWERSNSCP